MKMDSLLAISPLDGRYARKLDDLKPLASEFGLIKARLQVEIAWLMALAENPGLPEITLTAHLKSTLEGILKNFDLTAAEEVKAIEKTTNHDVKAVEYYLRQQLEQHGLKTFLPFVHFALTSEDVNNLSYGLLLKAVREQCLTPAMASILKKLTAMAHEYAAIPMLSRTHGQPATPTTLGKEIATLAARLNRQYQQCLNLPILGKLNGAVGNFNAHVVAYPDLDWLAVSDSVIQSLGLTPNHYTTQIEPHDNLAEWLHTLMRFNTILIDACRDMWGYISLSYFTQQAQKNEVGSSTMPHKINPIDFENAEGNLGLANALADHCANKLPISRWQRDLSDSTVLRNLGSLWGYSLIAYFAFQQGLGKLQPNTAKMQDDLEGSWEVLAEAIQTVMRRAGHTDAYEQLKLMTRGEKITATTLKQFVHQLSLPEDLKARLDALTPDRYIGLAAQLAKEFEC